LAYEEYYKRAKREIPENSENRRDDKYSEARKMAREKVNK